jgi:uncharacterized protein YrzB (UPF0473 family)
MNNEFERSTFKIVKDNEEIECEALFEFTSGEDEKNYIVYTTYSSDDKGNIEVHAGVFDPENESGVLEPVDSKEEWEIVESFLESVSEEEDESDQGFIEAIKKNWIQSILYYKYIVRKENEKFEYNNMKLPIGYKREYNKPNRYNLKRMVVRAPEIIKAVHKKKETIQKKEPVKKEEPKVERKPIKKEVPKKETPKKVVEKVKPIKQVSPVFKEKEKVVEKKKLSLPEIMEKAGNGLELSDSEKRQLDKFLEMQMEMKNKMEQQMTNVGKRRL